MGEGLAKRLEGVYICGQGSKIPVVISLFCRFLQNWTIVRPPSCPGQFFHNPPAHPVRTVRTTMTESSESFQIQEHK